MRSTKDYSAENASVLQPHEDRCFCHDLHRSAGSPVPLPFVYLSPDPPRTRLILRHTHYRCFFSGTLLRPGDVKNRPIFLQ